MWMIIAISVAYLIAGIASAVVGILVEGEPSRGNEPAVFFLVILWPVFLLIFLPLYVARWVKAKREASRDKPTVFSEYDEP